MWTLIEITMVGNDGLSHVNESVPDSQTRREEPQDDKGAPAEVATGYESAVRQVLAPENSAEKAEVQLTPEQKQERWLRAFEERFNKLSALHEGIAYADVVRSVKADPEAMKRLMILDENGHNMNVFGYDEKTGDFIFASAWNNYLRVAEGHRNITYDPEGQKSAEVNGRHPNGNAISIIAKIMRCEEEDADKYLASEALYDQLRATIKIPKRYWLKYWAWLQTDDATRKTGKALKGGFKDIARYISTYLHNDCGSFRAMLKIKKV